MKKNKYKYEDLQKMFDYLKNQTHHGEVVLEIVSGYNELKVHGSNKYDELFEITIGTAEVSVFPHIKIRRLLGKEINNG